MLQKYTSIKNKNLESIICQNDLENSGKKGSDHAMADRAPPSDDESLQEKQN